MPQVSIIVAVYAAEKYLRKCLDSLRNQSIRDVEIILVDDGSVDQSPEICDEYVNIDSRIKVIHKKNGGVASARQCGLDHAVGDYVIHVDPDDWIDSEMLEEMLQNAIENSSDMVICDMMKHKNNVTEVLSQKIDSLKSKDVMKAFFQDLHGSCCNKLVKRNLFQKFNISFPLNMVVWEDLFVCVMLTMHDIRISYIPKAYYHYVNFANDNSLVNAVSPKKMASMRSFIDYFDSLPNFDKSLLMKRKIELKRTAFLMPGIKKNVFFEICPEINDFYVTKNFDGFKKIDSLIRFAIIHSWSVSRLILFTWKVKQSVLKLI